MSELSESDFSEKKPKMLGMIPAIPASITKEELALLDEETSANVDSAKISRNIPTLQNQGGEILGGFQYAIVAAMLALIDRGEKAYGITIHNWLRDKTFAGNEASGLPQIYVALKRFNELGLVVTEKNKSPQSNHIVITYRPTAKLIGYFESTSKLLDKLRTLRDEKKG